MIRKIFNLTISSVVLLIVAFSSSAEVIYKQRSLYGDVAVVDNDNRRCMVFALVKGDSVQTCQYKDPADKRMVYSYSKMVLGSLLVHPEPKHILLIGLGGATIPNALTELYPQSKIDIVELDEVVVSVAHDYFHFQPNNQIAVTVADGRVFVKRALLKKQQYDFIILDAFTGDYIPEHMMTSEFLAEVKSLLTEDGTLVANTWSSSRLYDYESVTYQKVFGHFLNFKMVDEQNRGNRIIITSKRPLPSNRQLQQRLSLLQDKLTVYGIPLANYPALMSPEVDWNTSVRPLTDQYSPVNLLK